MDRYLSIISGKDRTWKGDIGRIVFRGLSAAYWGAVQLRNWGFDCGVISQQAVNSPVLSVGNLTTGGTGKTPVVGWLTNFLKEQGFQPGIVSRGYRTLDGVENDEKRLLDQLCPDVVHIQNPKRVLGAKEALASHHCDVIVLDDGFQHRSIHRDLDIVLVDALQPWGYNALLPRGLLREPLRQLRRADVVFITRCELANDDQIQKIVTQIRQRTSVPVIRTAFQPLGFVNSLGDRLTLEEATNRPAFSFCGIGNPEGFRRTLTSLAIGAAEGRFLSFPDHHHYTRKDQKTIGSRAYLQGAEWLMTTRKDLVKLQVPKIEGLPLWALDIGLEFLDDLQPVHDLLRVVLPVPRVSEPLASEGVSG
ncbi:tetraacyldisaccharide 4'-kinase [Planctomicrobium sp. SH668]|uniref:tetraacyldisaccharide 4'-kinase n=1 Tax=Planctomicrobium sp. SH668 TaxID=3448126 RepID=UPI003F5C2F69